MVCFHDLEINLVVVRSERPSELSWRARHGGKKLQEIQPNLVVQQSCAESFHLIPICAPEAPPAKRVKRSKEDDSLANDAAVGSGDVKVEPDITLLSRRALALLPTRTLAVRMVLLRNLILTSLKKPSMSLGSYLAGWMTLTAKEAGSAPPVMTYLVYLSMGVSTPY